MDGVIWRESSSFKLSRRRLGSFEDVKILRCILFSIFVLFKKGWVNIQNYSYFTYVLYMTIISINRPARLILANKRSIFWGLQKPLCCQLCLRTLQENTNKVYNDLRSHWNDTPDSWGAWGILYFTEAHFTTWIVHRVTSIYPDISYIKCRCPKIKS